ncbi:GGDEF domain-containing protein [Moorella sp. Hama-1]|uniref:GGDEF domain-containing protein n=1 Tax=Moorella sp. Hama-1 TaxID=2138101 RepID=UPI000D657F78|nr:GGDEF domain-containing protein [Moorella sp. Hama-1]BCV20143.1 GGDEF domain-containing protein [Moorella sp. Hama-1]
MGYRLRRAGWAAGVFIVAGSIFLSLATLPAPAVFWGLTWGVINGLAVLTGLDGSGLRRQVFLLGLNVVLVGGWQFYSTGPAAATVPFFLLLPVLVPLYRGQRRIALAGLGAGTLLAFYFLVRDNAADLSRWALLVGWAAVGAFILYLWWGLVARARQVVLLQAEAEDARREYQKACDRLAIMELAAITDDLTRIYNYRYFERTLDNLLVPGQKPRSLAVLMLDIDRFKEINDAFGHLTGNRVLVELAAILKEQTRDQDIVTRFGGEEFAVILPDTDYHGALQVAERIRQAIAGHVFQGEGKAIHLTVSTGVAVWPEDGVDKNEIIDRADSALYQAKTTGRNSVCAYRLLKVGRAVHG